MFSPFSQRSAQAYQRINVETSMHTIDQHQLVCLLYQGVLEAIAVARGAIARGDIGAKAGAISKAVRIMEEGLLTGLDMEAGGELAANLHALYEYCLRVLIQANIKSDEALLAEVASLIEPIAQSWNQIKKPAANAAAVGSANAAGAYAAGV